MSKVETFAPKVRMSAGYDYTPAGWEWIMAFAVAGCEWAIKEADKPEFRKMIKKDLRRREVNNLQKAIDSKLAEVDHMREEIRVLNSQ